MGHDTEIKPAQIYIFVLNILSIKQIFKLIGPVVVESAIGDKERVAASLMYQGALKGAGDDKFLGVQVEYLYPVFSAPLPQ